MQASRPNHESRKFFSQLVLSTIGTGVSDDPVDRVSKINLTLNSSFPGRRVGVLEIRHVDISASVERVYDHLAVDRASDLHASLSKISRDRSDFPFGRPNFTCLFQKI